MLAGFGARVDRTLVGAGTFTKFVYEVVRGFVFFWTWLRWERLARQLFFIGTMSVPILAITGAFIGMILAIEGYLQFASIGQEVRLGGVINISLTKQIGPVLAAVILAGRVGCSLTAELGSMRVTEQLDAMRAMAADPIRVLVCPRVAACVIMIPALTVVSTYEKPFSASDKDAVSANMLYLGQVKNGAVTFAYPEDAKRNLFVQRKQ